MGFAHAKWRISEQRAMQSRHKLVSPEEAKRRAREDQYEVLHGTFSALLASALPEHRDRRIRMTGLEGIYPLPPPWKRCRHGGPEPTPSMMATVQAIMDNPSRSEPCLQDVRLFETTILAHFETTPPPQKTAVERYPSLQNVICETEPGLEPFLHEPCTHELWVPTCTPVVHASARPQA